MLSTETSSLNTPARSFPIHKPFNTAHRVIFQDRIYTSEGPLLMIVYNPGNHHVTLRTACTLSFETSKPINNVFSFPFHSTFIHNLFATIRLSQFYCPYNQLQHICHCFPSVLPLPSFLTDQHQITPNILTLPVSHFSSGIHL